MRGDSALIPLNPKGFHAKIVSTFCLTAFAGAAGFFCFAFYIAADNAYFVSHSVSTKASIVELVKGRTDDKSLCPQFTFTTADAQTYIVTSQDCAKTPALKVGDTVPVFYGPQNPATARLDTEGQLRGIVWWEVEAGCAALLIGLALRRYAGKRGLSRKLI